MALHANGYDVVVDTEHSRRHRAVPSRQEALVGLVHSLHQ
jgi:hypothetical protein